MIEYIEVVIAALIVLGFITGIRLMQQPRTALWGNRLGAFCMALAILFTLQYAGLLTDLYIWLILLCGGGLGIILGQRIKMIQMPQMVALLNGMGGGASAVIAGLILTINGDNDLIIFWVTALLALALGVLTFTGSIVAALKLQGLISQKPVSLPGQSVYLGALILGGLSVIVVGTILRDTTFLYLMPLLIIVSALYGLLMALRVGGADMPIIIAFFNSLSGITTAICGLVVENLILAGVGSLVGVAGMILTQIMCRAMNRNLLTVLGGLKSTYNPIDNNKEVVAIEPEEKTTETFLTPQEKIASLVKKIHKVIIVPGYGMAVAQAQQQVCELIKTLENQEKEVKIAIHPVAGRMPGHMNVLLAEVGVSYEQLFDMEVINPEFPETDLVIVIGACDVINPAANTAEGSPIYGMPILSAEMANSIIVCNLDDKPGYSGVDNSLYLENKVISLWGNAAETVPVVTKIFREKYEEVEEESSA